MSPDFLVRAGRNAGEIPRTTEPPICRRPQVNALFYLKSAQWEERARLRSTEARRQAAFHGAHHLGHPALAELLHHLLHLGMLLQDPVDLLDLDAGPAGDPALAGTVDNRRMAPLFRRHRVDDRSLLAHLALAHL